MRLEVPLVRVAKSHEPPKQRCLLAPAQESPVVAAHMRPPPDVSPV